MATVLAAGDSVLVRLLKPQPATLEYSCEVISDDGNHLVVEGPWAEFEPRDLGYVRFQPGDVFTEHYWRDRWYSIKAVRDREGLPKGWYCDVVRPVRVEPGRVLSEDLVLDLWASPDGAIQRLDEDEFAAWGLEGTDPDAARRAREALDELERLAREGRLAADFPPNTEATDLRTDA